MRCLGKAEWFIRAIAVMLGTSVEAGSIHFHHSKAEIEAADDVRFYERVVTMRDLAPAKFDHVHPLTGRMLSDERVYVKLLHEWKEHPVRFELAHLCLWHVLDGDMLCRIEHPTVPALVPSGELPIQPENGSPQGGGDSGNHHNGGSDGGIHSASVPEPSSAALLISALIVVLLAAACRRAYERIRPLRQAGA